MVSGGKVKLLMRVINVNNEEELNRVRYSCKKMIVDCYYDPVLSGEIFEFLYRYIENNNRLKMTYFFFEDKDKYIDIKFAKNSNESFNDVMLLLHNAFEDLYKHLIYTPQYFNRMLFVNQSLAYLFSDVVSNYIDIINTNFTLYNTLLLVNNDSEMDIRIGLV